MDCKVPIKEHFRQPGEECRGKHEERYAKRYAEGYWKRYPKLKESFFMTNNKEHVLKCFENSYVSRRERNAKQEKNLEIKKICGSARLLGSAGWEGGSWIEEDHLGLA